MRFLERVCFARDRAFAMFGAGLCCCAFQACDGQVQDPPADVEQRVGAVGNRNSASADAGAPALTCAVWYRNDVAAPDAQATGFGLEVGGEPKTVAFDRLALTARLNAELDATRPILLITAAGSQHELPFGYAQGSPNAGGLVGQTGLIYVRDPASPAELQIQCFGSDRSATFVDPGGLQVDCDVSERSSTGGAIVHKESITLDGSGQKEVAFDGAAFWANLANDPLEGGGFAVSVGWGESGQEHGIRQLISFRSSGQQPLTIPNQLSASMTGTASVVTPTGTEVSFDCAAR